MKIKFEIYSQYAITVIVVFNIILYKILECHTVILYSLWLSLVSLSLSLLLGDRSFAVAGPRVWNSLPAALRAVEDYEQFKAQLKTHLFD